MRRMAQPSISRPGVRWAQHLPTNIGDPCGGARPNRERAYRQLFLTGCFFQPMVKCLGAICLPVGIGRDVGLQVLGRKASRRLDYRIAKKRKKREKDILLKAPIYW